MRILTEEEVYDVLRTVDDPELGVNIVDLGLVYGLNVDDETIDLVVGFTTPACPMSDTILHWIQVALAQVSDQTVRIDTESAPPWTPDRMASS